MCMCILLLECLILHNQPLAQYSMTKPAKMKYKLKCNPRPVNLEVNPIEINGDYAQAVCM